MDKCLYTFNWINNYIMPIKTYKTLTALILFSIIVLSYLNLKFGPALYTFSEIMSAIIGVNYNSIAYLTIIQTRLPIIILAMISGASLAISGFLLQRATQNPLASPTLLGIEFSTACSVIIAYLVFPSIPDLLIILIACLGAALNFFLMNLILKRIGTNSLNITLSGVAFNALYFSIIQGIILAFTLQAEAIMYEVNGSLYGASFLNIKTIILPFLLLISLAIGLSNRLDLLNFSDSEAKSMGINIASYRKLIITLAIFLTALTTSITGPILFFGLIVANMIGSIANNIAGIVLCAVSGAALLLLAQLTTSVIAPLTPPPVGLVSILLSTPILVYITKKYIKKHEF